MLLLTGCDLPWDPEGTTERVQEVKLMRVGIISTGKVAPEHAQREFLNLLADETGSTPQIVAGSTEALLPMIENGELDIVVGHFVADTPWAK